MEGQEEEMDSYAAAGVDIDAAAKAKELIKKHAGATYGPEVLSGVGFFGGLFEFKGYKEPVLVSHVDGVGTKVMIAAALDRNETIGIDIVNHCVNDILTTGAMPLFFLDYIAAGKMVPERVEAIVKGLASACRENGCALIGGETAEMPGLYSVKDYDLAGFILGVVEKSHVIMGKGIVPGDAIIGLPSNGLHTNGYSLVRKIIGVETAALNTYYHELGRTLGEELLRPHRSYLGELKPLLHEVKGLAHITGGGLIGNIPRVLPEGLVVHIQSATWEVPPIFQMIRRRGNITLDEMYSVFNMGIGMAVITSPEKADGIAEAVPGAVIIGEVGRQISDSRVFIDGIGYRRDKVG